MLAAGSIQIALALDAGAFPRNPERPFDTTNCTAATQRLREAERGSSIISPEENARVLRAAKAAAAKACARQQEKHD